MSRNARSICFLVFTLAALGGCSSNPAGQEAKKAAPLDKIQGKAQVSMDSSGAMDAALNAGGPSVYIREGMKRYRLFFRTPAEITNGQEYAVEGVYAQKVIDELGDPDQGKGGYPLESSCERVVRMVWRGLPMDAIGLQAEVLRTRVKRYPARPVFLVARIQPLKPAEGGSASAEPKKEEAAKDEDAPEVSVAADKQRALLLEGPTVQPAPLWEPAGGTANCKVIIGPDGKISELETGAQLCESMPWSQFRYKPTVQRGHPVKVKTEVEVRFEPRK